MCWVMPPASPEATSVVRRASSREVLPWSTWPMMATTGARGVVASSSIASDRKPASTSDSETRFTAMPNSSATSSAVSVSMTSLIFIIRPCFIRNLMMSTPRTAIRLDSSCTVMTSGMTTSRGRFGASVEPPLRFSFSRSRARRTEASERIRSAVSPSPATDWMVRRPSRRLGSPRVRLTALPASEKRLSRSSSGLTGRAKPPPGARLGRATSAWAGGAFGVGRPPGPVRGPGRAAPGAGRGVRAE